MELRVRILDFVRICGRRGDLGSLNRHELEVSDHGFASLPRPVIAGRLPPWFSLRVHGDGKVTAVDHGMAGWAQVLGIVQLRPRPVGPGLDVVRRTVGLSVATGDASGGTTVVSA